MDIERQNELETQRLNLQARISESDRAALDHVKTLASFKKAYPQYASEYAEAVEAETTLQKDWYFRAQNREWVEVGEEITHEGKTYVVIQAHALQLDWEPGQVPALYRMRGEGGGDEPADEWPEFVQPTGAHDAYPLGAKVSYKGGHYVSLIDNNAYSPEAYPQGWRKEE